MTEDKRTIEIYIGYRDGTWDTDYVDIVHEDIKPISEGLYDYMKEHDDEFKDMAFYGIYNIPNLDEGD